MIIYQILYVTNANRIMNAIYAIIIILKIYVLYAKHIYVNLVLKNVNSVDMFFVKKMIAYQRKYHAKIV